MKQSQKNSFLGGITFLPAQRLFGNVKASMVTVKCLVWISLKHFPPELYLKMRIKNEINQDKNKIAVMHQPLNILFSLYF